LVVIYRNFGAQYRSIFKSQSIQVEISQSKNILIYFIFYQRVAWLSPTLRPEVMATAAEVMATAAKVMATAAEMMATAAEVMATAAEVTPLLLKLWPLLLK